MKPVLLIMIAVLCNAGAQVCLKLGAPADGSQWHDSINIAVISGLLLYIVSFVLTIRIYSYFPLSVISPVMAGAIFVAVSIAASLLLAEPIGLAKVAGMILILFGIILLTQAS